MFPTFSILDCSYPEDNRVFARTRLRKRRLVFLGLRDLSLHPLHDYTLRTRPKTRRCRFLLTVLDLDEQTHKRYYLDSMRGLRVSEQPLYRIGIYDPCMDFEPVLYGPPYTDSKADRAAMRQELIAVRYELAANNSGLIAEAFPIGQRKPQLRIAA